VTGGPTPERSARRNPRRRPCTSAPRPGRSAVGGAESTSGSPMSTRWWKSKSPGCRVEGARFPGCGLVRHPPRPIRIARCGRRGRRAGCRPPCEATLRVYLPEAQGCGFAVAHTPPRGGRPIGRYRGGRSRRKTHRIGNPRPRPTRRWDANRGSWRARHTVGRYGEVVGSSSFAGFGTGRASSARLVPFGGGGERVG